MSKTALIINSDSVVGLASIRRIARLGYHVYSLSIKDNSPLNYELPFMNPELEDQITYIQISNDILNNPVTIISNYLSDLGSFDVVVSLNSTEDSFVGWDFDLIKKLTQQSLINEKSTVILARSSIKTIETENKTLEKISNSIESILTKNNIFCSNLVQVGAMEGDENYIADTIANEVYRYQFKTDKITSIFDIFSYLTFFYLPNFMLSLAVLVKNQLDSYRKIKSD